MAYMNMAYMHMDQSVVLEYTVKEWEVGRHGGIVVSAVAAQQEPDIWLIYTIH